MKKFIVVLLLCGIADAYAVGDDDPLLFGLNADELERRNSFDSSNDDSTSWEVQAWAGHDFHKLWLMSEGKRVDGTTEQHEISLLYGQAISTYWDAMVGWRKDVDPNPNRSWLQLGIKGTTPFFIETSSYLFIGEQGRTGLRLEGEKEWLLTQRWHLMPKAELNFHGHNDTPTLTGSGLSEMELSLRLAYQVRRELSPYIGIYWERKFGNTADFHRTAGENTSDTTVVLGIKAWY